MTLLDKAKEIKTKKGGFRWTKEHFELTKAWVEGEISLTQIAHVIKPPDSKKIHLNNAINMIMYCIREMRKEGLIKIIDEKKTEGE